MEEQIINLPPSERVTRMVHLPIDLQRELKVVAAKRGVSVQSLAAEIVQAYLDGQQQPTAAN